MTEQILNDLFGRNFSHYVYAQFLNDDSGNFNAGSVLFTDSILK